MTTNHLTKPFFETTEFPFLTDLESHWLTVKQELDRLLELEFDLQNQITQELDIQSLGGDESLIPPTLQKMQIQQGRFIAWPETFLYETGWEVFGLYTYGHKLEDNCKLCPETTSLIEKIPGIITAGFSSLAPGTHIHPHVGYTNKVLRCHLGLVVPDQCLLRVSDQTRSWQEGKCLIFDDTFEHEAWNKSDKTRIVLLLDFQRPN